MNKVLKLVFLTSIISSIISCGDSDTDEPVSYDPISFSSDSTWSVSQSNQELGAAITVCLNDVAPTNCPASATLYNYTGNGWDTDLSSIPGANWIWAPNITDQTPNASLDSYSFSKIVNLPVAPVTAQIFIACDDFASIYVNDVFVASIGSITDQNQAVLGQQLTSFNITDYLTAGDNVIRIDGQNGPDAFTGVTDPLYSENPAGVVFGGSISFSQ